MYESNFCLAGTRLSKVDCESQDWLEWYSPVYYWTPTCSERYVVGLEWVQQDIFVEDFVTECGFEHISHILSVLKPMYGSPRMDSRMAAKLDMIGSD